MNRILKGDVLSFARHYRGEKFHALLDVVFPDIANGVTVSQCANGFLDVVRGVVNLNWRQMLWVIEARVCVPETTLCLDEDIGFRQIEVEQVSSDAILLDVADSPLSEIVRNFLFKTVVRLSGLTLLNLLACQNRMSFAGQGVRELVGVCRAYLFACFWSMRPTIHAVSFPNASFRKWGSNGSSSLNNKRLAAPEIFCYVGTTVFGRQAFYDCFIGAVRENLECFARALTRAISSSLRVLKTWWIVELKYLSAIETSSLFKACRSRPHIAKYTVKHWTAQP